MTVLDKTIGALMVGSWVNSSLFVIECMQAWRYFERYTNDSIYVKSAVAAAVIIDTVSVAANYAAVYLYSVTHWGDPTYLQKQYWPIFTYCITTSITALIVQSYLVFRFYRATKLWMLSALLEALSIAAMVGSLATVIIAVQHYTLNERGTLVASVIVWLAASTVADIAVALTLVWQLRGMKSAFQETRSVLSRLIRTALQTGTITSIFATVVLITFLTDEESNVTVGIGFCFGRVETLTLLYNLSLRGSSRRAGESSSGRSATAPPNPHHPTTGTDSLGGIHVHRTAIVKIDEEAENKYMTDADKLSEHMNKDVF